LLSSEAIAEFKEIYERKFAKKISNEAALEMATELIELWRVIYRPIPKKCNTMRNVKITDKNK